MGTFSHGCMSTHHRQCRCARDQGAVARHVAMALRWQEGLLCRRLLGKTCSPGGLRWSGLRCCRAIAKHAAGEGDVSIIAPLRQEALRPRRHWQWRRSRHGLWLRDGFEDRLAESWILPTRRGLRLGRRLLRKETTVLRCCWGGEGSWQRHHRHGRRWCRGHAHRRRHRWRWAGAKGRRRKNRRCRNRRGRGGHRRPAHRAGAADPG